MIPSKLQERLRTFSLPWSPMAYKATLLTIVALAFIIPLSLVALPFIEFFNGMAAQPKGKTQGTYGRVMGQELLVERLPVEGTIPRSYQRYPFEDRGTKIEDAQAVGLLLENPLQPEMDVLERGKEVYDVFCIACHGSLGEGDGPVIGPDRFPAPPSLHSDQARGYADGTLYHIITKGVAKMPGYAQQVEPDDRWKTILYVRALQRAMNPEPQDLEP